MCDLARSETDEDRCGEVEVEALGGPNDGPEYDGKDRLCPRLVVVWLVCIVLDISLARGERRPENVVVGCWVEAEAEAVAVGGIASGGNWLAEWFELVDAAELAVVGLELSPPNTDGLAKLVAAHLESLPASLCCLCLTKFWSSGSSAAAGNEANCALLVYAIRCILVR